METPKITLRQAFWLFVNSRFIVTLVFIPHFSELDNNRNVIVSMLLNSELDNNRNVIVSMLLNIPMELFYLLIFISLSLQYQNQTLIQYSCSILGSWIGKIVGLLYIWYFIHQASLTLRTLTVFLSTRFFPSTPEVILGIGILMVAAYCTYMGLEVLGRCADFLVPIIFLGILLIVGLAIQNQPNWQYVLPTLEEGITPMLPTAIWGTVRWSELAWIAMILPFIVGKQYIKRVIYGGYAFLKVIWVILLLPIVAIFGPEAVRNLEFPTLELVQIISVGNFIERVDAIALGLWVFGAFLKISIFYYVAALGTANWFGIKDKRPIILPFGFIIFFLSFLLYNNIVELRSPGKEMTFYDFTFVCLIPLIMLIIHFVKKQFRPKQMNC